MNSKVNSLFCKLFLDELKKDVVKDTGASFEDKDKQTKVTDVF